MGSLVEVIKDPVKRRAVVEDCARLLDAEVADKKGLTGVAVKGAMKVVKKFQPNMIEASMDALLDDFSAQIDPFWQDCQQGGHNPKNFFGSHKVAIANALLSVTDERAKKSRHRTLVKAYNGLRGKAVQHIGDAMPRFSELVVKHAS